MSEEDAPPAHDAVAQRHETTPARSWAELVETLHGGLAVIDTNWRLTYVSDRFFPFAGTASDLAGSDIRDLLQSLSGESRGFCEQIERGITVSFEQRFRGRHNLQRWLRATIVPSTGLGDDQMAVVFTKETTAISSALALLHETTLNLAAIDDELNHRVARNIHDGPIQLLAALVLRLDLLDDPEHTRELRSAAAVVGEELRKAVAEFSHDGGRPSAGALLETWIAPFLADSSIDIHVEDHLPVRPTDAAVHTAFVYLYEVVRAARHVGGTRRIQASLADDRNGYRLDLTIDNANDSSIRVGQVAAQYRALVNYTHVVGGTLSTEIDNRVRTVTVWIPRTARPELVDPMLPMRRQRSSLDHGDEPASDETISSLTPLSDATWEELASAAPERLLEIDHRDRFSFANDAQADMFGLDAVEILGRRFHDVLPPGTFDALAPDIARLEAGLPIDITWQRTNALGELRRVRFKASPRLDDAGGWLGLLTAVDDLTDVRFHAELWRGALADLTMTRRRATEHTVRRLEAPLVACDALIELLEAFEMATPDREPFTAIRIALTEAISGVRRSRSVLEPPDLTMGDLGGAVRTSLEPVLADTKLVFVDNSNTVLSTNMSEDLFRIAREAVVNGVIHGKADVVTMTLDTDDGIALAIHDNGMGVDPTELDRKPGHLGTRAMSERARERGGSCRIEPDERGGTLVSVWLPHPLASSTPSSFQPAEG
jgi:PAS domain S-box-containing protein